MWWTTLKELRWSSLESKHIDENWAYMNFSSVLLESARIARGAVKPLSELTADDVDAAVFPGGFGAAKNLSDFGFKVS